MDSSEILSQYGALSESGALTRLEEYKKKADGLDNLLAQSVELFTRDSERSLVDHVVSVLMQSFIPCYLAVFLDPPDFRARVTSLCYRNMQPCPPPVSISSFDTYRVFFDNTETSVGFEEFRNHAPQQAGELSPLNPEIIVPLQGLNGLYGIVVIGAKVLDETYTAEEREFIDRFFVFASIGLQNLMHYERAVTDGKTGLYNHSFFDRRLHEEMMKVHRYHSRFSLLVIDIDHFKKLNDRYGHPAGDEVLYRFAVLLQDSVREEDIVARYGGEEFLVLLVECYEDSALRVAERIRSSTETAEFMFQETALKITVSIGITHCHSPLTREPTEIVSRADHALYLAKQQGRNRVNVSRGGLLCAVKRMGHV